MPPKRQSGRKNGNDDGMLRGDDLDKALEEAEKCEQAAKKKKADKHDVKKAKKSAERKQTKDADKTDRLSEVLNVDAVVGAGLPSTAKGSAEEGAKSGSGSGSSSSEDSIEQFELSMGDYSDEEVDSMANSYDQQIMVMKARLLSQKKRSLAKYTKLVNDGDRESASENEFWGVGKSKELPLKKASGASRIEKTPACRKAKSVAKSKTLPFQNGDHESTNKGKVDISYVRADYKANRERERSVLLSMTDLGDVADDSGTDSSSDDGGGDKTLTPPVPCRRKKASKRSKEEKLSSGLFRCSSSEVRKEVVWPMDKLGPQHSQYGKAVYHKDLDMRLLVLGELEIISGREASKIEKIERMKFLKEIIFNAEHFEWSALLRLHAAVLREIELGNMDWGESHSHMTQLILTPYPKLRQSRSNDKTEIPLKDRKTPQVWYCKDYNGATCSLHDKDPFKMNNGSSVEARHVCAKCYMETKQMLHHASSSSECPRK